MLNTLFKAAAVVRVRRNHALEHATLHVLGKRNPRLHLIGNSDLRGFWVLGCVDTQELQQAVDEAVARLKTGERNLAVHHNCGTNFAVSGVLASLVAWLGLLGTGDSLRRKLERLPLLMALVTLTLILAQPLGPLMQARLTTQPDLGNLKVVTITRYLRHGVAMHRIETRQ